MQYLTVNSQRHDNHQDLAKLELNYSYIVLIFI